MLVVPGMGRRASSESWASPQVFPPSVLAPVSIRQIGNGQTISLAEPLLGEVLQL